MHRSMYDAHWQFAQPEYDCPYLPIHRSAGESPLHTVTHTQKHVHATPQRNYY